jgi:hypothetical protein
MSNSIRRPRRRPRVRSLNFRTFGWVLLREVAVEVLSSTSLAGERRSFVRQCLVRESRHQVIAWVSEKLPEYDRRRRGLL